MPRARGGLSPPSGTETCSAFQVPVGKDALLRVVCYRAPDRLWRARSSGLTIGHGAGRRASFRRDGAS
jgi:hypothetical protein